MSADLADLAEQIVDRAEANEELEVYVSRNVETEILVRDGEIESLSRAESIGAGIRVISESRTGFSYAGTVDEDVLLETLAEARDNARYASPDEFAGLAVADVVEAVELDLWDEEILKYPTPDKVELAMQLERTIRQGDSRIRALRSSQYGDGATEAAIASTNGIRAAYRRTGCFVSALAIAGAGDETQTGSGYSVARAPGSLDVDKAAGRAIERSTRLLGATKPDSAKVTVVFDNTVTPSLLSILSSALNGESVLKGRSFFVGRQGERVAVPGFTLVDDPTNPLAYAASSYDGEGLATRRNELISDGVLSNFLYDSYAARRAGRTSNGAAVRGGFKSGPSAGARALSLTPGPFDQAAILASVDNGILVQGLSGVHSGVNPVSGDFSVGAEGLLIAGGQLGAPVREFTIASTIQRMLQGILHIGSDVEWLPGPAAGVSLAIADISMSGN